MKTEIDMKTPICECVCEQSAMIENTQISFLFFSQFFLSFHSELCAFFLLYFIFISTFYFLYLFSQFGSFFQSCVIFCAENLVFVFIFHSFVAFFFVYWYVLNRLFWPANTFMHWIVKIMKAV